MDIEVITGDITVLAADAVVNAANCALAGGGGVDGAIHRAAGPELDDACARLGYCPAGEAKITPGFNLPAGFIIHTPGPVWRGGNSGEEKDLRNCYLNSLRLAAENNCRTVAFPCISTGVYGYPKLAAAEIALDTVRRWTGELPEKVIFCCFSKADAAVYQSLLK